jgi:hypothetical protein
VQVVEEGVKDENNNNNNNDDQIINIEIDEGKEEIKLTEEVGEKTEEIQVEEK